MFMALSEQKEKIVDGGNGEQEGGETVLEMYKKRIPLTRKRSVSSITGQLSKKGSFVYQAYTHLNK